MRPHAVILARHELLGGATTEITVLPTVVLRSGSHVPVTIRTEPKAVVMGWVAATAESKD